MKRLFFTLIMMVLVGSLFLGSCAETAPAPAPEQPPIKIGVIYPLTGPMAMTGERMAATAEWAFAEAGYEVAGKKLEVLVEDSGATPDMAADKAKKLVEYDKVSMVIGPLLGPVKMAVAAYLSKMAVPHINTHPAPWGMIQYEWAFMVGGSEPQYSSPMGIYAYEDMGLSTVTVITEDTVGGHTFLGAFMDAFTARGGQVIQEQYAPFPCQDYASYLAALKETDAVVAWFHGADAIRFLTQFHEFGIRERMPLVAAFYGSFFAPFVLHELPPEAGDAMIDEYCATPYTTLLETEANKRFVTAYKQKFGSAPDDSDSGAYAGALVALQALKATQGDTTPEKLRQAIVKVDIAAPEGRIVFDPETRFTVKNMYISQVKKIEGNYVWAPVYTYENVPPRGY